MVECGGYGYVAINSSVIDLGGDQPQCCFGRGGHVLYANSTDLHLLEARRANRDDSENMTALHTGSQWVILDRAFSTYLVTDPRALHWHKVQEGLRTPTPTPTPNQGLTPNPKPSPGPEPQP